ncbi:MFS transporter [Caproiciproducens sp. NJN-50]|uniref:MFS transporter n=1 Tax=Caproiciproducens sp. NJN-50 TaxID=2507162 RepID=UPI001FAAD4D3|nr:MFS transporter [Caproiciproducens sp. NJN-50]
MSETEGKPAKEKLDPAVLKVAIILVVGALAPLFDSTMINVAIHTIAADMKADISVVQWITTGYVLAMGLAVPISGWTTKRFGCKRSYTLKGLSLISVEGIDAIREAVRELERAGYIVPLQSAQRKRPAHGCRVCYLRTAASAGSAACAGKAYVGKSNAG